MFDPDPKHRARGQLLVRSILAMAEFGTTKQSIVNPVNPGAMVSRNRGQNVAQGDEDFIGYKEI